jgi:hypothetical protein
VAPARRDASELLHVKVHQLAGTSSLVADRDPGGSVHVREPAHPVAAAGCSHHGTLVIERVEDEPQSPRLQFVAVIFDLREPDKTGRIVEKGAGEHPGLLSEPLAEKSSHPEVHLERRDKQEES